MKRTFKLEALANDVGYSVTLRINGRAFAASAIVANGDTVGSTYKQIVTQLAEVYGSIERKPEYADIAEMREQVYFIICSLNKIVKLGGQHEIDANALIREAKRQNEVYKLRGLSKMTAGANTFLSTALYSTSISMNAQQEKKRGWLECCLQRFRRRCRTNARRNKEN